MHLSSGSLLSRSLVLKLAPALVFGLALGALPAWLSAQDAPAAPAPSPKSTEFDTPRFNYEVYSGFSYFRPVDSSLTTTFPDGSTITADYGSAHTGNVTSLSYFFSKYVGAQIEAGLNPDGYNDGFWAAQGGIVVHKPSHSFQPFLHFIGGATEVAGPNAIPRDKPYYHIWTWEPSFTVGGGLDRELPFYNHHFSVRLVQADYSFFHADFGSQINGTGGSASINAVRLSAGLVAHPGWVVAAPLTYTCVANPSSVFPGDPVTVTGTATGLNPKKPAVYSWSAQGLTIKGDTTTGTIDTSSSSAGNYSIAGHVSQGSGKHVRAADCSTSLTVKAFEPPSVSCSANPATVAPGESSTITAAGMSPQNRPLSYSFSSSAGQISGAAPTATLSTGGAPGGPITVTCNVTDDKGQTGSASTTVTVAPVVPPPPHVEPLCTISFDRDPKRPGRVDNEAKACLDSVALAAKNQVDATLVLVGESTQGERTSSDKSKATLAAQRAANTRAYLNKEESIDASRITIRTGSGDTKAVENYLVPAGAAFESDVTGTTVVPAASVTAEPWKPLGPKQKHSKKSHNKHPAQGPAGKPGGQ